MKKTQILILIIFTFIGCESPYDNKLSFKNDSNKEIFVKFIEKKDNINYLLSNHNLAAWNTFGHFLAPNSSANIPAWSTWEEWIETFDDKKVYFYVFDADAFWSFRSGYKDKSQLRYKCLEFTKEELIEMNWQVVFKDSI